MIYCYAPIFIEVDPDSSLTTESFGAVVSGETVNAIPLVPLGTRVRSVVNGPDHANGRWPLAVYAATLPLADWVEVSSSQLLADYPEARI